jgi:hypothetical protein
MLGSINVSCNLIKISTCLLTQLQVSGPGHERDTNMSTTQIVFGTNNITNNWSWGNLWPVQRKQLFLRQTVLYGNCISLQQSHVVVSCVTAINFD